MKYSKWIRHYPDGQLGSLLFTCRAEPEGFAQPLQLYKPDQDVYPEQGYLMCWRGIREGDIPAHSNVSLWEVDVDEVPFVRLPGLLEPFGLTIPVTGKQRMQEFWANPQAYSQQNPGLVRNILTGTVFCTRIRLIRNLTGESKRLCSEE